MSTADKLNKLLETKQAIKQAIIDKGVEVSDDTVFADYPSKIDSIEGGGGNSYYEDLFNQRTNNGTDFTSLFESSSAKVLDVSKINTSNVTTMMNMFSGCQYLESLDVSNFNTSKVWNMYQMFHQCKNLESLDVSNFNTSNVTNMGGIFYQCLNLKSINLSIFNTSKVTTMADMFEYCQSLTSIDLSNFDTSKVTSMSYMFANCTNLTSLDVSNFDTSNVTNMRNVFAYCSKLIEIKGLNNWNIEKVTSYNYVSDMFNKCSSLASLDVSSWDFSKFNTSTSLTMFEYCQSLVDFYPPQNINAGLSLSQCTVLSHDSLIRILNNLMTQSSTKTLTLGSTNLAKLTAEEIAIATNKGWTVK